MYTYLDRFDTQSVNKRLGFILSVLNLFDDLRNEINKTISDSYAFLDPSLPRNGKHVSHWKIVDNVDILNTNWFSDFVLLETHLCPL